MKKKGIIIVGGVIAVGVIGYFVNEHFKNKQTTPEVEAYVPVVGTNYLSYCGCGKAKHHSYSGGCGCGK
tara:strand:+ start:259 stop:465 length:207 start_codon:yes stop_codon:yes gene_type:complete